MKRDDPTAGSKHKAVKSGQHHKKESHDLPESYGETRVVLLPVSPTKVFAFWDIAAGDAKSSGRQEGQPVLRFHETDGSSKESRQKDVSVEMPIKPDAKSSYMNLQQPAKSYQAEIGYKEKEGRFTQAAQSNVAETPRPLPAPEKTRTHQPPARPLHHPAAPGITPQPSWSKAPEKSLEHRPSAETAQRPPAPKTFSPVDQASARQQEQTPFAPSHNARTAPRGIGQPSPEHSIIQEGESSRSTAESEALLIKRRTAIFRHLSEAVPLFSVGNDKAGNKLTAERSGLPGPDGIPRKKDLTEISEQKFVAGLSS